MLFLALLLPQLKCNHGRGEMARKHIQAATMIADLLAQGGRPHNAVSSCGPPLIEH